MGSFAERNLKERIADAILAAYEELGLLDEGIGLDELPEEDRTEILTITDRVWEVISEAEDAEDFSGEETGVDAGDEEWDSYDGLGDPESDS